MESAITAFVLKSSSYVLSHETVLVLIASASLRTTSPVAVSVRSISTPSVEKREDSVYFIPERVREVTAFFHFITTSYSNLHV